MYIAVKEVYFLKKIVFWFVGYFQVVYTELNYAQILVHCELLDIMTNKMFTTNVFNYTYEYKGVLQNVVPQTYRGE